MLAKMNRLVEWNGVGGMEIDKERMDTKTRVFCKLVSGSVVKTPIQRPCFVLSSYLSGCRLIWNIPMVLALCLGIIFTIFMTLPLKLFSYYNRFLWSQKRRNVFSFLLFCFTPYAALVSVFYLCWADESNFSILLAPVAGLFCVHC